MGLTDTARSLRQEACSKELQFLKYCRWYIKKATPELINKQNKKLIMLDEKGTEEALREACRIRGDILEAAARRSLYLDILEKAEKEERRQKGGGERLAKEKLPEWKKAILEIHRNCEEIRQFQIRLPFDEKEGENSVGEQKGNDPFAAADGQ